MAINGDDSKNPPREAPTLLAQLPLDVSLIVQQDVLGARVPATTEHGTGHLLLPTWRGEFTSQPTAPPGLEKPELHWGSWTSYSSTGVGQAAIDVVGMQIELDDVYVDGPVEEWGNGYAAGIEPIKRSLGSWIERFQEWGTILARQALSPFEPSPAMIERPSLNSVLTIVAGGRASWPSSGGAAFRLRSSSGSALSERVADAATVRRMCELASDPTIAPPSAVALVASARRAAQRNRLRLALMELRTALEAILTTVLSPNSRMTLGPLTQLAIHSGISILADIHATFVVPRNSAVHRGQDPSQTTVIDGLAMLDGLIHQYYSAWSCDDALDFAHRPQRQSMLIVAPPQSSTT